MPWHFRRHAKRVPAPRVFALKRCLTMGALALALLIAVAACRSGGSANAGQHDAAAARNHVPAGARPQFARVTFTTATTYEQARALLASVGTTPYPWACSDAYFGAGAPLSRPRSVLPLTTPPPSPEQDTPSVFAISHQFVLNYPTEQQLNQLAASNLVGSIDAGRLPACL